MKKKLTVKEYVYVASMLFGLFFGAGNLIFPTAVGQLAGRNMWSAILGLLITGVGLPLLGVAALGLSRSDGLFALSSKVNRPYAYFFTCALYLTIGPFFAIPRCATVSFTVGLEQILPQNGNMKLYLLLFTLAFFIAALLFSLRPGKILTWVGKILNPFFRRSRFQCGAHGRLHPTALPHRLFGGLQHHGRPCKPCLRHHRGTGHPGTGR